MDVVINLLKGWYTPVLVAINSISGLVLKIAGSVVFLALSIIVLGFLKVVLEKILEFIQLDKVADTIGVNALIQKGIAKATLSSVLVAILYWLSVLGILVTTLNLLGVQVMMIKVVSLFTQFIPNVLSAVFVLVVAGLVAVVVEFIIKLLASYVSVINEALITKAASFVIYLYAVILAIGELGIVDNKLIDTLIVIAAIGFVLSAALGSQKEAVAVVKSLVAKSKKK